MGIEGEAGSMEKNMLRMEVRDIRKNKVRRCLEEKENDPGE